MDLKGISWVGNFYQKFEAMCLEVEEIMYQDTVKYVENQVQTVGSNVKKFYSDVMQDLLPPSSMDAAKGADSNLSVDFYGDVGVYMKPKKGMKEKKAKVDDMKKPNEDKKKIANDKSDFAPTFRSVSHVDNLFPLVQEDFAGGASRKNNKEILSNKSNLRTRKNSKTENVSLNEQSGAVTVTCSGRDMNVSSFFEPSNENHLGNSTPQASRQSIEGRLSRKSNEVSRIDTPCGEDLTTSSSVRELSNENHNSFHQEARITTPRSAEMEMYLMEESQNETASEQVSDIPSDGPSSDVADLAEIDMRASSGGASVVEPNAASICGNDGVISSVESCTNWQVLSDEIACGGDFLFDSGRSRGWNIEVNEVDTSFVSEMEVIQQVDKAKLEESCIIVNRDDLHFLNSYEGKKKSYQKKICDVFSPRKSSTRKHEYEQLALWPVMDTNPKKEECAGNSVPSLTIKDGKRSSTADICEAEWELI